MRKSTLFSILLLLTCPGFSQVEAGDSLLVVSLRHDFTDSRRFSREPQIHWVGFDRQTGLELREALDEAALAAAVRGKNVLVLVHGMGVPFPRAMNNFRRLAQGPLPYDLVLAVTWPALEINRSAIHNAMVFLKTNTRAKKAGKRLAGVLADMTAEARSLDIFTHSLGAKVALSAVKRQEEKVDNVFLTAPAIGAKSFQPSRRFGFIRNKVRERILVFFSQEDPAFQVMAKHKMGRQGATGKKPAEGEKIVNVDCTAVVRAHSAYWQAPVVWEFLKRQVNTGDQEKP